MSSFGNQQGLNFRWMGNKPIDLNYLLYLPRKYDTEEAERWPLVLFLHGSGARGTDLELLTDNGLPMLVKEGREFPFILVSPQCPLNSRWPDYVDALAGMLDEIEGKYLLDQKRVYVTGLSMGGAGTWALAIAHPQRFAAVAPICGRGDASRVCAIRHLPVWAFHGAKDDVVPLSASQAMVDALKGCDGNVRFTIYPEARHNAWTQTYDNPEFYVWLLSHRKDAISHEER